MTWDRQFRGRICLLLSFWGWLLAFWCRWSEDGMEMWLRFWRWHSLLSLLDGFNFLRWGNFSPLFFFKGNHWKSILLYWSLEFQLSLIGPPFFLVGQWIILTVSRVVWNIFFISCGSNTEPGQRFLCRRVYIICWVKKAFRAGAWGRDKDLPPV